VGLNNNIPTNIFHPKTLHLQTIATMEKPLARRRFLGKLSLAVGASIALPVNNIAQSFKVAFQNKRMNPVLSVKPLGFQWETADPFLFCVHHEDRFPKGNDQMGPSTSMLGRQMGDDFIIKDGFRMYHGKVVPGFPGHPHRGFETITVVRKGLVDHADSLGAAGRYGDGDVQWMTAGKGVQHSEMFPLLSKEKENPLELFQIWLNLPKKSKMVEPHFKMLWRDAIPNYLQKDLAGKNTKIEIIAGKLDKLKAPSPPPNSWAADEKNEVAVFNIKIDAGGKFTLPKAGVGINRTLYFYEGESLQVANQIVKPYHAILVQPDIDLNLEAGAKEVSILVLQGRPIGETVIQYGPFVMNTKEEINQAFEDYHRTQFGGWPWPKYDQVHDRNKSRFAKHADGKIEVKTT
jgi:redox-sensitive bicupin YhaK (pirin superfamily)